MNTGDQVVPTIEKRKGIMIACEGPDGAGKSTNVKYIVDAIAKRYNRDVVSTREPGGTPMAEQVRSLLLAKTNENVPVDAEILLFYGARSLHIENLIKPSINEGKVVVCDRFSDSTFAYQCAHGADYNRIKEIHKWTLKDFVPDYTFFFFVAPDVARERLGKRLDDKGKLDRFDDEASGDDFIERTIAVFLRRINEGKSKYIIIDSSKSIENTQLQIDQILETIFTEEQI